MIYNEPKDWLLPVRHYLGRALLKANKFAEAEAVYRKDLTINPHNGWALTGLQQALEKQGKKAEAEQVKQSLTKAFSTKDVEITVSA